MEIEYACTYINKDVQEDEFTTGCDPKTQACIMSEKCDITAATLPRLIAAIADQYCLAMDDIWLPDDQDGGVTRIGFNRLEDADGCDLEGTAREEWKAGTCKAWLADYDFQIEKRTVSPIPYAEFADIKHHD